MDGNAIEDNYRPTQELNNRTVFYHNAMGERIKRYLKNILIQFYSFCPLSAFAAGGGDAAGGGEEDTCTNPISDQVSQETAGWTEDYCCGDCYICGLWHDSFDDQGAYGII